MKTIVLMICVCLASMVLAKPSIAYATKDYQHDTTKVSGLEPAGVLGKNGVTFMSIVGKPGEIKYCSIVIDDPEGIKEIKIDNVEVFASNVETCPISFSQPEPLQPGSLSHIVIITAKIQLKDVALQYTLSINGQKLSLPLSIHVINEE